MATSGLHHHNQINSRGINNNNTSSEGQGQTTTFGGTVESSLPSPSPLHHNLSSSNMFVSSIESTPTPQLQPQTTTTMNLPSGSSSSSPPPPPPSSVAGGFLLPALKYVGKFGRSVIDFLQYDENDNNNNDSDSNDSTQRRIVSFTRSTIKILLTAVSVIVWYPSLTSHMVGALQYLWDHQWYLLSMTTSVAILFASLVFTTSYEWMWRWQDSVCGNGSGGGGGAGAGSVNGRSDIEDGGGGGGGSSSHVEYTFAGTTDDVQETRPDQSQNQYRDEIIATARRRSRLVVTVDDHEGDNDDDDLPRWIWKLVRKWTPGFGGWYIYSICMTELSFKLWMEYDVAHEAHGWHGDLELRLVNVIMSMFFLFGAASFQWWYFPTNRRYFTLIGRSSTNGTTMISNTEDSDTASAMQSLL